MWYHQGMQPERSESHTISSSGWQNLHRVTTVSKYLALLLFIALPFLGGWVGYTYAPTKTVEVTRSVPVVPEAPATVATESERPHEWYDQATQRLATSTATVTFTG